MSAAAIPCPRCSRGTNDGLLCDPCLYSFLAALGRLATLLPELAVAGRRQTAVTRFTRHRPGRDLVEEVAAAEVRATPARLRSTVGRITLVAHTTPVNLDAVELAAAVRFTLVTWVSHLHERYSAVDRPVDHLHRPCSDLHCSGPDHLGCHAARAWRDPICWALYQAWVDVRWDDAAGAIVTDVLDAAHRVEATVDRRDAEVYVGPCDAPDLARVLEDGTTVLGTDRLCGTHLYAQLGDRTVTCPTCGQMYPVSRRREWLLQEARPITGRPAEIARWLAAFDVELTAERLDQWISRDRRRHQARCLAVDPPWAIPACTHLWPVGLDSVDENGEPSGRPVYLVGDVLDRLELVRVQWADKQARQRIEEELLRADVASGVLELVTPVSLVESTLEKLAAEKRLRGAM